MWKILLLLAVAATLSAQSIRTCTLDPEQVVDLPVSREITTILFPAPITALAGADVLIEDGKGPAEIDETTPVRFHLTHAPGANFVLARSLQPEATARLTAIFEGSAYVLQLRTVPSDSTASLIFKRADRQSALRVDAPPAAVKFSPRIGLSLLDRARAYPALVKALPAAVEGVTFRLPNRKTLIPNLEITLNEIFRFSKEDALVFLLTLKNTSDQVLDLAPESLAVRIGPERFPQAIANGPRVLAPGESAEAEFAIVGMPDGTRNDLSADNFFNILINSARREAPEPVASSLAVTPTEKP